VSPGVTNVRGRRDGVVHERGAIFSRPFFFFENKNRNFV